MEKPWLDWAGKIRISSCLKPILANPQCPACSRMSSPKGILKWASRKQIWFPLPLAFHHRQDRFCKLFAVFASGRTFDQIRQGICIGSLNVKIIGSSAVFSDFVDGATHQSVEDIAIMRAIPNMTVIAPCDGIETRKAVRAITEYNGPVYMRLSRNDLEDIYPEDQEFIIGKPVVLKDGTDIAVFAAGTMVGPALEAAAKLGEGRDIGEGR